MTETTPSTASWITAPGADPQHPILRTTFTPRDRVTSARLLVTGLGAFHAHLNGSRVSADELAPGQTHFGKTVLLNAYDVTDLINRGRQRPGGRGGSGLLRDEHPERLGLARTLVEGQLPGTRRAAPGVRRRQHGGDHHRAALEGEHRSDHRRLDVRRRGLRLPPRPGRLDVRRLRRQRLGRRRDRRLSRRRADDHPGGARPGAGGRDLRRLLAAARSTELGGRPRQRDRRLVSLRAADRRHDHHHRDARGTPAYRRQRRQRQRARHRRDAGRPRPARS